MKVLMEKNEHLDYKKVQVGCMIVLGDTFWSILYNPRNDQFILFSLKTNEVIEESSELDDITIKLRGYDVKEIFTQHEFFLKVTRN